MKDLLPGIVFTTIGLAVLEGIGGIIVSSTEYIKASINIKTAEKQIEINKMAENAQPQQTSAIGFTINSEEEFYDE